jgi:tetratricopeptide (TPR) repeat protein/DNA-directed RNA polymerase subunit RPC12/RpoP
MRIECEVCSATYTIDDAQLSDQPIGAQCPYCGHVRLVKRGDAGQSANRMAGDLSLGGPPPPSFPAQGPPPASPFATGNGGGSPFGGSPFGGGPSPFSPPSPFGASGGPGMTVERSAPPPPSPPPPKTAPSAGQSTCQVCGTPLSDEFDKVIGLCDVHQRDRRSTDVAPASAEPAAEAGAWYVRGGDGRTSGPMGLDDLRSRIRSGDFSTDDQYSTDGRDFGPLGRFKEIAYLASLKVGGQAGLGAPRSTFAKPRSSMAIGRLITPLLVIGVVGGAGFLAYAQRAQLEKVYTDLTSDKKILGPSSPNPLKRYLAKWSLAHPDVSGTAHEHLVTAKNRHLEDTWRGYELAEQSYQRALLLDANDASAIAGYVENLAIWRYHLAASDELAVARSAVAYAKELSPENPAVHRAQAALSLAGGDLNGCRSGADEALERDATDGRAKLLLAGCYMEGNVRLAIQEIEHARRLLPELKRADRVLADAYTKLGRFASALKTLDERLAVDPDNGAVHLMYGDVNRDLGFFDKAKAAYLKSAETENDVQLAHIALGDLAMEVGQASDAISNYRKATEVRPIYGVRAVRAYSGWAMGELLRGRHREATRLAERALKSAREDPTATVYISQASLVRGEAGLMAGSATTAATWARRALESSGGEPAAMVLLGRAAIVQGRMDEANKHLEDAAMSDAADPRLKGIVAATYLTRGGYTRAFALMRRAADTDPLVANSRRRASPLAISVIPVNEAIEQFKKASAEDRNESVANAAIGMMYYHLGDRSRAQAAIDRSLRTDASNVSALIYAAQLALDRGDASAAQKSAQKLLAVERGSALGYLLLGRSEKALGHADTAINHFEAALRSNPGLLVARVEMAEIQLGDGDREALLGKIQEAFRVDPHALETRTILYRAGL